MSKPKVSIITTYYNCEKFITQSMQSVLCQVFDPEKIDVEYVLVNDRSTDTTHEIVDKYIKEHRTEHSMDVKMYTTPKNLGCGGARRYGIEKSTGNLLMFLDADDYYMKTDFVSRAVEDITESGADMVEYGLMYNNPSTGEVPNCLGSELVSEDPQYALCLTFQDSAIKFHVWTKIITRDLVNSYAYSTARTFEDVDTIPVWVNNAKKIVIKPSIEINYRCNDTGIINSNQVETRLGTCKSLLKHFERFKNNREVLKSIYKRAYLDLKPMLDGRTSIDEGFDEMSEINTKMLSYLYPNDYQKAVFNLEKPFERGNLNL